MHPVVSLVTENVLNHRMLFAPLLYSIIASVANVHEPVQHSLLVATVSWGVIWLYAMVKVGFGLDREKKRVTCWLAGALVAFAQICDRAAVDKEGSWTTKACAILRLDRVMLTYV